MFFQEGRGGRRLGAGEGGGGGGGGGKHSTSQSAEQTNFKPNKEMHILKTVNCMQIKLAWNLTVVNPVCYRGDSDAATIEISTAAQCRCCQVTAIRLKKAKQGSGQICSTHTDREDLMVNLNIRSRYVLLTTIP